MKLIHSIRELREQVSAWKAERLRVALVPTMGNLHEGHLDLVLAGRKAADRVVSSVFVNPTQFGEGEDYEAYPRTLDSDAEKLEGAGADLLFAPSEDEVYPGGRDNLTLIEVPYLSHMLCGQSRPKHFSGVATVVSKLFNMCQPDVALFGEKDFQQLAVIRQLTLDLNFPVEIQGVTTRREVDGLAMSSRNQYLQPEEREQAPFLHQTLQSLAERIRAGDHQFASLEQVAEDSLRDAGFRPDYVSVRRVSDLLPPTSGEQALVVLAAAYLGKARLIDNIRV